MTIARTSAGRPLPMEAPVAKPYFDAAREGRLLMQHCPRDGAFFYPRSACPKCLGSDWEWRETSPTGSLHSFTVDRMGQDPGQKARVPFVIALVDMLAGPRLIGNMDVEPVQLRIGTPVRLVFDRLGDSPLIAFTLADASDAEVVGGHAAVPIARGQP